MYKIHGILCYRIISKIDLFPLSCFGDLLYY